MGLIGALKCPIISRLAPDNKVTMSYVLASLSALERLSYHRQVINGYYDTLKEVVDDKAM